MTRYYHLTTAAKLALTSEELEKSVQLEAAERGIAIPISIGHIMAETGYRGFSIPADSTKLFELLIPGQYSPQRSGLCFTTLEAAEKALEGAIAIVEEGYGESKRQKIAYGEFAVQVVNISLRTQQNFSKAIEDAETKSKEFDDLCREVTEDLHKLRQAAYDVQVTATKKAKYLELADGNEQTARRFWKNIEKSEWDTPEVKEEAAPEPPSASDDNTDVGF